MSRLDLVAGPNGAGKSTFVARILVPARPGVLFVNADLIAADRWPDSPEPHAYEAARIAAATRSALIAQGREFIAETVFSHPSKLELIEAALAGGYFVSMHVLMIPEDLAVARVTQRVRMGGHSVPENKIRERHRRLWPIVIAAAELATSTAFWDNSTLDGPALAAETEHGVLLAAPRWPAWTPEPLTEHWPSHT